ncbi:MAG: hypothetical protein MJE68_31930 [Proteobacteria bacterium]|nr:hypothetical protein [Pseudomonadota bacterium]
MKVSSWHRLIDHCINTHDTMHHACATCGQDFNTKDEKAAHCSDKHTGKCWLCSKDFVLIKALQAHLRDEHGVREATSTEMTKELEEEHQRRLEQRSKWEKKQREAARRKIDDEDDDDDDADDPDYRPSKKQLKRADRQGDK